MSIDLVAAALWLPLEPNRKLVLIALCERADFRTGLCWPGRSEIAIRASLSPKRVTEHTKALKAEGLIRHERPGNSRTGETTHRWLDVGRILEEGERRRNEFREGQLRLIGEEREPDPFQGKLLGDETTLDHLSEDGSGDVDGNDQGTIANDQGTLATLSGDAVSRVTVREPSGSEPSYEPPIPDRAGEQKKEDESFDPETAFAIALTRQLEPTEISRLFGEDGGVEIVGHVVRLKLCATPSEHQAKVLLRVAQAAGCSGWETA